MPITKRPCSNCPFRNDGAGIELSSGRLKGIIDNLKEDDNRTFVCHKTLNTERKTCAGAVAVLAKANSLPLIARLALVTGDLEYEDIEKSKALVIEPEMAK